MGLFSILFNSGDPQNPVKGNIEDITAMDIYGRMLTVIADTVTTRVIQKQDHVPDNFCLEQNYPNPFNPVTNIRYALPKRTTVELRIYNVRGQEVDQLVHATQDAGYYTVVWNASIHPSGIYFVYLKTESNHAGFKCLLLK